jgi:hypothetical protein
LADKEKPKKGKFDKYSYDRNFVKTKMKRVMVYLNKEHDADIIEFLDKQKSKSEFIKQLIRDYISK